MSEKIVYKIRLSEPEIKICADSNSMERKMLAQVAKAEDEMFVKAIIRYAEDNGYNDVMIIDEKSVKELLERQIPKAPIGDLHGAPHYGCPNCKSGVAFFEDSSIYPFCHFCGQALIPSKKIIIKRILRSDNNDTST